MKDWSASVPFACLYIQLPSAPSRAWLLNAGSSSLDAINFGTSNSTVTVTGMTGWASRLIARGDSFVFVAHKPDWTNLAKEPARYRRRF
jgi:hypothetical protein